MRTSRCFPIKNVADFKRKLLVWGQRYNEITWLDSNHHIDQYSQFEAVLAIGAASRLTVDKAQGSFEKLKLYQLKTDDYIFGYLSYDLKNDIEPLGSTNHDGLNFPALHFFQPQKMIRIQQSTAEFLYLTEVSQQIDNDFREIHATLFKDKPTENQKRSTAIQMRMFKDVYFRKINELLQHIYRGDLYEANFCQEFYIANRDINVAEVYDKLNAISTPPFACFLRLQDHYLLCASPERYLQKIENTIISQPIKGTAKRSVDPEVDTALKNYLAFDPKERAENIMIVDLVRNDLSRFAQKGSVVVEELCQVYSFAQVHHMISTISAQVDCAKNPIDIIAASFPMGSMTGAPKISAMKIIEKLEGFKRGLYSGSVGYFAPNGDFDFNVVIRSILHNTANKYTSFAVGSAITAKSDPMREYEECLLKAKAMREVLGA